MALATDGSADISLLHPIFVRRLEALFADPRLARRIYIVSAVRTRAAQTVLHECYEAHVPGCNVAADPDRPIGDRVLFGETIHAEGSWHMQQDGPVDHDYGYAVDINYKGLGASQRAVIEAEIPRASAYANGASAPWGLYRTVESPKWEPWHIQPIGNVTTPYDNPEELTMADVAAIMAKLENIDRDVAAVRGKVEGVDEAVMTKLNPELAHLDDRLTAVEEAVIEAMNGGAGVVRRGDKRFLLLGNRRTEITALSRDQQVEIKNHVGIERDSAEVTDSVWAKIEALTDLV